MRKLCVKNLTTDIFQDLSFTFSKPGLYGFVGRNGVGKSTLFSFINGEIKLSDTNGSIEAGKVAYIPNLDIFDKYLTANDYLKLLSSGELDNFQKNLDKMGGANFFNQRIGKYSLGMKELFAFLYVLSIPSDVLILDELLDGLDEHRRFLAYNLLKEKSLEKLIVLTSHNLSEVFNVCDEVYILEKNSLTSVDNLENVHRMIMR